MKEIWKDIKGYEGLYQISDLGRVKSLERFVKNKNGLRLVKESIKKTHIYQGYECVGIYKDNISKTFRVHALVANCFLGKKSGFVINHIDGVKTNNHLSNLEFITQNENMDHAVKIGLIKHFGEKNINSKITDSDAFKIKFQSIGLTKKHLSKKYGISVKSIYLIQNSKTWKHIKKPSNL